MNAQHPPQGICFFTGGIYARIGAQIELESGKINVQKFRIKDKIKKCLLNDLPEIVYYLTACPW